MKVKYDIKHSRDIYSSHAIVHTDGSVNDVVCS